MTAEQAAKYLGCESVKAFEKIASREGIPKHYLSARAPRYNRTELDEWLMGRQQGSCRLISTHEDDVVSRVPSVSGCKVAEGLWQDL